ncbi:MAG: toll/interleukin-1 receptor domain-containing protein, partial [Lachnospiraceae bacterium]|nr:toll/interleukin-1 receptor domain-containing protein [Lachnospiraceae bacterium]
ENLHKKLENYKLPKSVLKKLNTDKTRIERVFRDEAELPLSDNLSDPITAALTNSKFLIVICTPRFLESVWCKKEVETFIKLHDRQHVLLVLAEGEPEDSFPEILMYEDVKRKDENGNEVTIREEREPLAADCRADNNRDRLKALDNVVIKLAAAMFNLNYDDLKQRHRERKMRRRIIALSAAFSLITIFALTCLFFMIKISRQNKIISDRYAGSMAVASEDLLSRGLRDEAVYAVRSVLPDKASDGYNADALRALTDAVAPYESKCVFFPEKTIKIPAMTRFFISDDSSQILVNSNGYSSLIDIEQNSEICRVPSSEAILSDMGIVYMDAGYDIYLKDPESGNETLLAKDGINMYYEPGTGETILFTLNGAEIYKAGERACEIDISGDEGLYEDTCLEDVFVTKDGHYASFVLSGFDGMMLGCIDMEAGELMLYESIVEADSPLCATDGETVYLYSEEEDFFSPVGLSSYLTAIDIGSKSVSAEAELPGGGFYYLIPHEEGVLLVSDSISYMFDSDLTVLSDISGYSDAGCVFEYDPGLVLLDRMGNMETYDVFSDDERTFELYGHNENTFVTFAGFKDDRLYIRYEGSDRLVIYSPIETRCEVLDDISSEKEISYSEKEISVDGLEGADQIDMYYATAAVSDDGKYTVISSLDDILYFYDADGKKIKEIYDTGIFLTHHSFPYLEKLDAYVIGSAVFDSDLNMIAKLPNGDIEALGNDGESIVIASPYSFDRHYKIRLLTYDEIIKKADEILKDYVPDAKICDKYSIGYDPAGE